MKVIVDRIENSVVVCEDDEENIINISLKDIIGEITEGVVLVKQDNFWKVSEEETKKRREYIAKLVQGLWDN